MSLLPCEQRVSLREQACDGVLVRGGLFQPGSQLCHLAAEGADELCRTPLVFFVRLGALQQKAGRRRVSAGSDALRLSAERPAPALRAPSAPPPARGATQRQLCSARARAPARARRQARQQRRDGEARGLTGPGEAARRCAPARFPAWRRWALPRTPAQPPRAAPPRRRRPWSQPVARPACGTLGRRGQSQQQVRRGDG